MSRLKIELNRAGVRELLQSAEITAACTEAAQTYLSRLGEGYKLSTYVGRNRVNVSVYTETKKAKRDNAENNTMLRRLNHD